MAHVHHRRVQAKRPTTPPPPPHSTTTKTARSGRPRPVPNKRDRATVEAAGDTVQCPDVPRTTCAKRGNRGGSVRLRGNIWEARFSIEGIGRPTFKLPTCRSEEEAKKRCDLLAELVARLLAAGQIVLGLPLLRRAGTRDGRALKDVIDAIDLICKHGGHARPSAGTTFAEFVERYLSGTLADQHPDHVRRIKSVDDYQQRLDYVIPHVGAIPLDQFTLEHADYAMRQLPRHLEPGTRRNVAKAINRILSLAAYPAKIIKANPIPRGWLPKKDDEKAKGWLYPDEEKRLVGATSIPLCFRIYYAFLAREGMRSDEAGRLEWTDLDLERGAVRLDQNKTDDPRAWALAPDVVRALRIWRVLCPSKRYVFVGARNNPLPGNNGAERFRDHLLRAGIDRAELFEHGPLRLRIRLHDLRATFITVKLADGRTETWIADRTGHKSSNQINNYRRAARTVAELGLGDLAPMDQAIPELRQKQGPVGSAEGGEPAEAAHPPSPGEQGAAAGAEAPPTPDPGGAPPGLGPGWASARGREEGGDADPAGNAAVSDALLSAGGQSPKFVPGPWPSVLRRNKG